MSQSFKFRYEEMRENEPGKANPHTGNPNTNEAGDAGSFYPSGGGVRNVCFVLLDGRRVFLNYAYLVSGEYSPEENTILLAFTTHAVVLKGIRLENLYEELMQQLNKIIACVEERYNGLQEGNNPVVNAITIHEK